MRFRIHSPEMLANWPEVYRAYISGVDGRVFATRVEVNGEIITCRRPVSESGRLHVSWPVAGFGRPVVSTASLPEREEPYGLCVELARGKIAQLRDQVSNWEIAGMTIPPDFREPYQHAHRWFQQASAVQHRPEEAENLAAESLRWSFQAGEIIVSSYAAQRLSARRKRSTQPPAALGCYLAQLSPGEEQTAAFRAAFTAAVVGAAWLQIEPNEGQCAWELIDGQVEWCQANRLFVYGGPLLDFGPAGLPQWLAAWQRDLSNLQSLVCDHVETVVARYAGRIRNWSICTRAGTGGALGLSEESRLSLVARALDVVRQIDDEVQVMIQVDQPWGEYQSRGTHRLSPMQFVDALLRAGIGLSAVNLEVAFGFRPRGSAPRDLLDVSRLLDLWSTLGIPLYVTLVCPSACCDDPLAVPDVECDPDSWRSAWSPASQAAWISSLLALAMAKQSVVGIFWSHFSDQALHEYPNAGLVGFDGQLKPALEQFTLQRHAIGKSDNGPSLHHP